MNPETFLRFDPGLMDEAVFLAVKGHPGWKEFYRERDRIYGIDDPEERESASRELNAAWFIRLGLAQPIEQAITEQPSLLSSVRYGVVARTAKRREEGAELFVDPDERMSLRERRVLRVLLKPESLLDASPLLTFLRHELMHIVDMVDPIFGYEPSLPEAEGGPAHDALLKERYRALWDATIDGRMGQRGWAPASVRAERMSDFRRVFPMLGEETEQIFSHFFDREPHTHAELVAFAYNPRATFGRSMTSYPGSRCPLCGFPTYAFEPEAERLPAEVIAPIVQDFPQWQPSDGLCTQCTDLYRARRTG